MTAPYCAIDFPPTGAPLPAAALWADDTTATATRMLTGHRTWHTDPDSCTGWIDVTATTLTPLFTGATAEDGTSLRLGPDGSYVIPDTALTGLLRNTIRIITGGRVGPISSPALFLRAPVRPNQETAGHQKRVQEKLYQQYTAQGGMAYGKPSPGTSRATESHAGFLKFFGQQARIAPIGENLTLPLTMKFQPLAANLLLDGIAFTEPPDPANNANNEEASNTYTPTRWHPGLHGRTFAICYGDDKPVTRRVWGVAAITDTRPARQALQEAHRRALNGVELVQADRARRREKPMDVNTRQFHTCTAVLYFTGITGNKRSKAYFFPEPPAAGKDDPYDLTVPADLIDLYESAAQLTRWQKNNFPATDRLHSDGQLDRAATQPIWYTTDDNGGLVAFGRSGGFRVAIAHRDHAATETLLNGIPAALRPRGAASADPLDITEALFGAVDTTGPVRTFRRRVLVGTATPSTTHVKVEKPVTVQLLSPQRGCFTHYLQQTNGPVTTWADTDATLRGYKLYLHRWDSHHQGDLQARLPEIQGASLEAGVRTVQPLSPGNHFTFRITYTNLTRAELGCLLYALQLNNPATGGNADNPTSAHKIGLGKGIGFGSVHLAYALHLINLRDRYAPKDAGDLPRPAAGVHHATDNDISTLIDDFGKRLAVGYPDTAAAQWRGLRHLRQLHAATAWRNRLLPSATATMPLNPRPDHTNEPAFDQLLVLPDILNRVRSTS